MTTRKRLKKKSFKKRSVKKKTAKERSPFPKVISPREDAVIPMEVAEMVQASRSKRAVAMDSKQAHKILYEKPTAGWAADPGSADVIGIDDVPEITRMALAEAENRRQQEQEIEMRRQQERQKRKQTKSLAMRVIEDLIEKESYHPRYPLDIVEASVKERLEAAKHVPSLAKLDAEKRARIIARMVLDENEARRQFTRLVNENIFHVSPETSEHERPRSERKKRPSIKDLDSLGTVMTAFYDYNYYGGKRFPDRTSLAPLFEDYDTFKAWLSLSRLQGTSDTFKPVLEDIASRHDFGDGIVEERYPIIMDRMRTHAVAPLQVADKLFHVKNTNKYKQITVDAEMVKKLKEAARKKKVVAFKRGKNDYIYYDFKELAPYANWFVLKPRWDHGTMKLYIPKGEGTLAPMAMTIPTREGRERASLIFAPAVYDDPEQIPKDLIIIDA